MGGRPLPFRLRRTTRPSAVSSSFVNRLTELTKPRGGCPTTRDPGQDPSVPAPTGYHAHGPMYGAYVMLCPFCACKAKVRRRVR